MKFAFDEYELDAVRLELKRDGAPIRADRMVLRLLAALVQDAGELVTKDALLARVWERRAVSANVITVSMARLRRTLGQEAGREFVVSVQGRGYRFVRPVRALALDARDESATRGAPGPVLWGREPVLQRMRTALAAAAAGRGGVCMLTGEPGIGKTALAEQLSAEAARAGLTVAWAYCQELGETPPLWPFAQLARSVLAQRSARSAAPLAPELRWLLHGSADARPEARHRLFEAVLDTLENAASSAGAVLVVDDLHRADAASLELLRYWIGRIARSHVLLVATARLERRQPLAQADLRHVLGHRNCTRLPLGRLAQDAVHAYVASALPDADGVLARAVWAGSEGNPFFMVEHVRQLADAGAHEARGLEVTGPALEPWRARILELALAVREVLSAAAVIGRRFELRLLQRVTGQDLEALRAHVDAAVESEALLPPAEGDTTFAFGHELIRKLLYDALPPGARRTLHRKIGEALSQRARDGEVVPHAALAYHFHAALPDVDPSATLAHCQLAAVEASYAFAHADGMQHLQRALDALSLLERPSPAVRWLLLLQRAVAARLAGAPDFLQWVHEAAEVARAMRSGASLIEVGMLLHLHPGFPLPAGARALLEEGLALLNPEDDAQRGAALARLTTCGPLAFDGPRSRAQLAGALALVARGGAFLPTYNAHSASLYLHGGPGGEQAAAHSAAALDQLAHVNPGVLRIAPILRDLHDAMVAHRVGALDAAQALRERALQRCEQMGARELRWHVARYLLLVRLQQQPASAIAAALRALHACARTESVVGSAVLVAFDEAAVLGDAPMPARSRAALAPAADDPPSVWSIKVQALAAAGLRDEAHAALCAVPASALARLPADRDYLGTLGALARAALVLDARQHAAALLVLLAPHAGSLALHGSFLCLGPVSQLCGELAAALGRRDEASEHLRAALRTADRLGLGAHAEKARRALTRLGPRASLRHELP